MNKYAVPQRFTFSSSPVADPKACVIEGNARFTVLTSRCIRMEYSPEGHFEDRASIMILNRNQPVPRFTVHRSRGTLTLSTDALTLTYDTRANAFTPTSLQIALRSKDKPVWHYGDKDEKNLGGTFRTLDGARGAVKLDAGLMSRSGWSVVDDSASIVFDSDCWVTARAATPDTRDLYFFGYGNRYQECLRDFCAISGRPPLVPRWALGNWWSRYWEFSHEELLALMNDFRDHRVPLSVCIIDMDWHITRNKYTNGWTGYTWNRELFPDPAATIKSLHHDFDLKVALNLHPHDGVHPHEEAYEGMARFMGQDPLRKKVVPFDIANRRYADGYFKHLHHPHEKIGVDFWWMDWQQGQKSSIEGLDPLFMLNHLHFMDLARDGSRRPFIFSRWHGLGNHRYQIGFSGDTIVCWESLAAQPHFTATASNVGYSWWSHDIGGHFWGVEDPELYIRWVQFGVFAPILRLHSSKNRFQLRTPWGNGPEAGAVAGEAMRLRHHLVPYIYSMAARTHGECLPLIRPMYWEHGSTEQAYCCPRQYYFGTELIAAPFVAPRDPDTRLSRQVVWLPEGDWYHFTSGERFSGDSWHAYYGTIEDMPVFAKAGAIVPMNAEETANGVANPSRMTVRLFAGADGAFELYEDDGESTGFERGQSCTTRIAQACTNDAIRITVGAAKGTTLLTPSRRSWTMEIVGVAGDSRVKVTVGGAAREARVSYDRARGVMSVGIDGVASATAIRVDIKASRAGLLDTTDRTAAKMLALLQHFKLNCNITDELHGVFTAPAAQWAERVRKVSPTLAPSHLRFVCEHLFGAGAEVITDAAQDRKMVVLWSNRPDKRVRYDLRNSHGKRYSGGTVPRFRRLAYTGFDWGRNDSYIGDWGPWELALDYAGLYALRAGGDGHGPVSLR